MEATSVRTVTLNQGEPEKDWYEVIIGMRNGTRVKSTGDNVTLGEVINAAIQELGINEVVVQGNSFNQTVFVNAERAVDPSAYVEVGSTIVVDKRKSNG